MAGLSNGTGANLKFVSIKSLDTEDNRFFFCVNEKKDGHWQVTDKYTNLTGKLLHIEFGTYEYNNDKIPQVAFYFDIGQEQPIVKAEGNMNIITRSMLNTFLSAVPYLNEDIRVSFYKNKSGYNSLYMCRDNEQGENGGRLGWKFSSDEFPRIEKAQIGGKTVMDDSEVNRFFAKWIKAEVTPKLPGLPDTSSRPPSDPLPPEEPQKPKRDIMGRSVHNDTPSTPPRTKLPQLPDDEEDDLPF